MIFVHIPPYGKPGTRELQEWWKQGELMPPGDLGSPEYQAYFDKTYEALLFILREARDAGFKKKESYDLELGQGIWWGAPACPRPFPSTTIAEFRPGGRIFEFERSLIQRLRADHYQEPLVWWGSGYHHFENCIDAEIPPEAAGRALSFYSSWTGDTTNGWLSGDMYNKQKSPNDVWPVRAPLKFVEGDAPGLVLARPEGWMADRTRRDNLIALMQSTKIPVKITSLGTVPSDIPDWASGGFDGWQLQERGLTRSLAFWLNQGSTAVLLHSATEPGSAKGGEASHALIPQPIDPQTFRWYQAPPLVALKSFCDGLAGAKQLKKVESLSFRYRVQPDPILIPPTGSAGPLKASDALTILPFQLDETSYAVAVYAMTPNIAVAMPAAKITLEIDKELATPRVESLRPSCGMTAIPKVAASTGGVTSVTFDLTDDVTWLRFKVK